MVNTTLGIYETPDDSPAAPAGLHADCVRFALPAAAAPLKRLARRPIRRPPPANLGDSVEYP